MKNVGKAFLKILIVVFGTIILFLLIFALIHHSLLYKNKDTIVPKGELVSVNGHQMHVYAEGEPDAPTIVFLSGSGVASPTFDYKVLYSRLADDFRVVVVEKPGYGYSEVTDAERNVTTIIEEYRSALEEFGAEGEYILMPHSMGGIEALYWAQTYPDEVTAIIGLDMALPQSYLDVEPVGIKSHFLRAACWVGLHRIPVFNPISRRDLSEQEIHQHLLLSASVTMNQNVMDEIKEIRQSAKLVSQHPMPEIPLLMFSSDGSDVDMDSEKWISYQREFAAQSDTYELILLQTGHFVHYEESPYIAAEIVRFYEDEIA